MTDAEKSQCGNFKMESAWTYENAVREVMHSLNQGFGIVRQERNGIFRAYVTQYKFIPVFGGRMTCCLECAFDSAFKQIYGELKEAGKIPEKDCDGFFTRVDRENVYCSVLNK